MLFLFKLYKSEVHFCVIRLSCKLGSYRHHKISYIHVRHQIELQRWHIEYGVYRLAEISNLSHIYVGIVVLLLFVLVEMCAICVLQTRKFIQQFVMSFSLSLFLNALCFCLCCFFYEIRILYHFQIVKCQRTFEYTD